MRRESGGGWARWSDPPDSDLMAHAGDVFADVSAHIVPFENHLTGGESTSTGYVCGLDNNTP